jgi:hypothetical protein
MSSQIFHRISYGRVQKIPVWEQLEQENLELFDRVGQEYIGNHLQQKSKQGTKELHSENRLVLWRETEIPKQCFSSSRDRQQHLQKCNKDLVQNCRCARAGTQITTTKMSPGNNSATGPETGAHQRNSTREPRSGTQHKRWQLDVWTESRARPWKIMNDELVVR